MIRIVWIGACCLGLSGCASVFQTYPDMMAPVKQDVGQQKYDAALHTLKNQQASANHQLDAVEAGRVEQLAGNYTASQQNYHSVIQEVQQQQLEAKVQLHRVAESTAALFVNDQILPYRLQGYEVVFLYTYQALNYLGEGDLADALVSIRQGQNEQSYLQQQHEAALAKADAEADKRGFDVNPQHHAEYFASTMAAAQGIKSSLENAYFYYVSALLFDIRGDQNNAYISIQRALALAPQNRQIQRFLLEILEQRGGSSTQIHRYLENFGMNEPPKIPEKSALVSVIVEQGWVEPMSQIQVPFIDFMGSNAHHLALNFRGVLFSIPVYAKNSPQPALGSVSVDGETVGLPLLMNVKPLAAKALQDDYPILIVREVIRVIAKQIVAGGTEQGAGQNAGLLVSLLNLVSSNADLRSWLTLPQDVQVWQDFLPLGAHVLTISVNGHTQTASFTLDGQHALVLWAFDHSGGLVVRQMPVALGYGA